MKVCLYAHNWHYIDLYVPLIDELKARGIAHDLLVYFPRTESSQKHLERRDLVEVLNISSVRRARRVCSKIPLLGEILMAIFLRLFMRRFLRSRRYSVVVTNDDRGLYFPLVLLESAMKLGIPTILFPIETFESAESNYASKGGATPARFTLFQKAARWIVSTAYPASTVLYHGHRIHFYISRNIIPLLPFPFLTINPWLRGMNQHLTRVAVNSSLQRDECVQFGVPANKIVLTGSPVHDSITLSQQDLSHIRERLARERGLISGKKIFLIIGTHLQGVYPLEVASRINHELGAAFTTVGRALDDTFEIICKVHPNLKIEDQLKMVDHGIADRIHFMQSDFTVYQLIAVSDAILTFGSSSIAAALATNVPLLAYRAHDFSQSFDLMHEGLQSVLLIHSPIQFAEILDALRDGTLTPDMTARTSDATRFGVFDGRNTERFLELIENL